MTVQVLPFIEPAPRSWADETLPLEGWVEAGRDLTGDDSSAKAERMRKKGEEVLRTHRTVNGVRVWRVWIKKQKET